MSNRVKLLEDQADSRLDDVLALRFAFLAMARALNDAGALSLDALAVHLARGSEDLPLELLPVSARIAELAVDVRQM